MSPDFLTLDEVLEIHRDQIERYGGAAGIRDLGLLQSALAQPSATFGGQYLHADLHEMAAAYLYHLVQNHPFLDGNKRVGAAAAITFLFLNNLDISVTENDLVTLVLSVAQSQSDKTAVATFFREHSFGSE